MKVENCRADFFPTVELSTKCFGTGEILSTSWSSYNKEFT